MENVWIGGALTLVNGLVLIILSNIRADQKEAKKDYAKTQEEEKKSREETQKDMWHRIYSQFGKRHCNL